MFIDTISDLIRAMIALYDDMTRVFKLDLIELRKTKKLRDGNLNVTWIQSCIRRAKDLRTRLEALLATIPSTGTFAPR